VALLVAVGFLWGAALQRTAALTEIASVAPILLVVIGPVPLVAYLGWRIGTGRLTVRMDAVGAIALVVGALVGNAVTPGLAGSVTVSGHLTGTLDGSDVDAPATCVWGPGLTAVAEVDAALAGSLSGGLFSQSLPAGTLVIDLPAGSIVLTQITTEGFPASLPLRNGSGDVGEDDRATGSIALDTAQGAVVAGELAWTCEPAPDQ
jgi:hypothetical protein